MFSFLQANLCHDKKKSLALELKKGAINFALYTGTYYIKNWTVKKK